MSNTERKLDENDSFDLVELIEAEILRVFKDGLNGDSKEYEFLQQYGISEADDVRLQIIGEYQQAMSEGEDAEYLESENEEAGVDSLSGFLLDDDQVGVFLQTMLARYRSIGSEYVPD